jgi:phosphoribosylformylglycinamidine cyclo-ligase
LKPESHVDELGMSVGDALLESHRCYVSLLEALLEKKLVKAMAHITGGGLTDNIPRVLPPGTAAKIDLGRWTLPPIFRYLRDRGEIVQPEMLRTFNVGIGMVVMVAENDLDEANELLSRAGEPPLMIGEIAEGDRQVVFEGVL